MTGREHWKKMLPIIQAFVKGEVVQYNGSGEWRDIASYGSIGFDALPVNYRIKPKPKYRPFNSKDECWQEMLKHEPFGWIIYNKKYYSICDVTPNEITILYECDPCCLDFKACMEELTFTDGTPFGIKET